MKLKMNLDAGGLSAHNEAQVCNAAAAGLRVKTRGNAGALAVHLNEAQVRGSGQAPGRRANALFATVASALLFLLPTPARSQNPNPGVLPPNSAPAGMTYGEWSAKWFKWAYEPPTAKSPVLDTTGANCAVGQSGHVWFLAGTLFPPGPPAVVRTCTIPAGKMLFFPVGNGFCVGDGFPNGFADERVCATQFAATLSRFSAEVDGVSINNLQADLLQNFYRALSPEWDLVLGADNVFGAPAGTYSPGAGDGVYLMLTPLSPGQHTIHFHADITAGGQIDSTYHLTVGH